MKTTAHLVTMLAALTVALVACAALAAAALAAPRIGPGTPASGPAPRIGPGGPHGASGGTSYNWSGYSVSGGAHTSVTATWTQPSVAPRAAKTYVTFWVGLDGDGNDTVEQIGTLGYTRGGRSRYVAWYEMYPAPMREITSLTIHPGDVVTATVQWTGSSTYRLSLRDRTTGRSFVTKKTSSGATRASAEIIAEAPADAGGVLPLATFGLVSFTGCAVDGGALAAAGPSRVDMVDAGGSPLATTSDLSGDGAGFSVSDDYKAPKVVATGLQRSATTGWQKAPVSVRLRGVDGKGGSGVAAVFYALDGGAVQTYRRAFTVPDAGSHSVKYWAADKAGNTGAPRTGYVNLDLAAPASTPSAVDLTRAGATRGAVVSVPVAVSDPPPSSGAVTLVTRITGRSGKALAKVARSGVAANATRTVRLRLRSTLRRGVYELRTVATDAAGNVQTRAGRAVLTVR